MPQAIIFANPDGSIVTTVFTHDDETLIQRDVAELQKPGVSGVQRGASMIRYASPAECVAALPPRKHRRFRRCWRWQKDRVVVDMEQARAQCLDELRCTRNEKLAATDGPFLRDQEQGKDVSQAMAYRQALRDLPVQMTAELAALKDADALLAYTPEMLK
jgi:hypothetical protein